MCASILTRQPPGSCRGNYCWVGSGLATLDTCGRLDIRVAAVATAGGGRVVRVLVVFEVPRLSGRRCCGGWFRRPRWCHWRVVAVAASLCLCPSSGAASGCRVGGLLHRLPPLKLVGWESSGDLVCRGSNWVYCVSGVGCSCACVGCAPRCSSGQRGMPIWGGLSWGRPGCIFDCVLVVGWLPHYH